MKTVIKKISRIIALVLVCTVVISTFAGCSIKKKSEITALKFEEEIVNVDYIVGCKTVIENYQPADKEQESFLANVLGIITDIESGELNYGTEFKIFFSDGDECHSWEDCCNYANNMQLGVTKLASWKQYILYWAQKWLEGEVTLETICTYRNDIPTIAFFEKNYAAVGSCYQSCGLGIRDEATLVKVRANSAAVHICSHDGVWQACIVIEDYGK